MISIYRKMMNSERTKYYSVQTQHIILSYWVDDVEHPVSIRMFEELFTSLVIL